MQLSIIIVSYNTADLTIQTIRSVVDQLVTTSNWSASMVEFFIVDNASDDDSVEQIKTVLKTAKVNYKIITNNQNLGFAKANNQAMKIAQGEWFWLLNSDVILGPGCLDQLFHATQTAPNQLGLMSPRLLNSDLSAQNTGGDLPSLLALLGQFWFLDDLPLIGSHLPSVQKNHLDSSTSIVYRGWLPGTALLMRKSVFQSLGGLDENLFMYAEDIEYCWRAKKTGYLSAVVTQAQIIHLQSASSDKTVAYKGEFLGLRYLTDKLFVTWRRPFGNFILWSGAVLRAWIFGTIKRDQQKGKTYQEIAHLLAKTK